MKQNIKGKKPSPETCMGIGIAIGITLGMPLGTAMGNVALGPAVGVPIGVAIGTLLQRKYGYKQKRWSDLSAKAKKVRMATLIILVILIIAGIVLFSLVE